MPALPSTQPCKPLIKKTPWVSLKRDQLIPVKRAVNEKEELEKGLEEEGKTVEKNFLQGPSLPLLKKLLPFPDRVPASHCASSSGTGRRWRTRTRPFRRPSG
jgi:hypothetical protein